MTIEQVVDAYAFGGEGRIVVSRLASSGAGCASTTSPISSMWRSPAMGLSAIFVFHRQRSGGLVRRT
ncbi:MAG: hypothetical protein R2856_24395 [Caldilineaceae bacterium]